MLSVGCWTSLSLVLSFLLGFHALKCYESTCYTFPDGSSLPCEEKERNCDQQGQDRCMIIRAKMVVSDRVIYQEVHNCTYSAMCSIPRQVCNYGNASGHYRECKLSCCHGNLCNNSTRLVNVETVRGSHPTGTNLRCYHCTSSSRGPKLATDSCSKSPAKQTCGTSPTTGLIQDRCMTITVRAGLVTQVLRNCSDALYCTGERYCKSANKSSSGALTSCDVSCCHGNLCNNDKILPDFNGIKSPNVTRRLASTLSSPVASDRVLNASTTVNSRGVVITKLSSRSRRISYWTILTLLLLFNTVFV